MIKRSSREKELKRRFKLREMSSISTLEWAWENKSLWPRWLATRISFCWQVAGTNKLELLKWAREEKKCEWMKGRLMRPHINGNLEMVKYCVANECPIDEWACADAAQNGHLECLKYLREEAKAPWDSGTASGRLKMVISTYSNILLSVSMIIYRRMRVSVRPRTAT